MPLGFAGNLCLHSLTAERKNVSTIRSWPWLTTALGGSRLCNSLGHMIGRILEEEACIRQLLATDCKHSHLIPTWQDLDVLESMRGALGPLEDFTDMLSGRKRSLCRQSNQTYIIILGTKVLKISDSDTNLAKSIKRKVWNYLQNKYDKAGNDGLLNVCTY